MTYLNCRLSRYLCVAFGALILTACAEKHEPVKLKTGNAVSVTSKPTDAIKAQAGNGKTLAGVIDAFKVGEADTSKYGAAYLPAESTRHAAASPSSYKSTSRLMPIVRYSGNKPKIPGGERPGDAVGPRAGDRRS